MMGRNNTSQDCRDYFAARGLRYMSDPAEFVPYPIREDDIFVLYKMCVKHIKAARLDNAFVRDAHMRMSARIVYKPNRSHSMASAFLFCNADYFKQREAISFNPDGFVGFAGWAASQSAQPLYDAFTEWVDWFVESYGELAGLSQPRALDIREEG